MPKYQVITENSKPSIVQLKKWCREKTKVILHQSEMFSGVLRETTVEGTICQYTTMRKDDPLVILNDYQNYIYVRNIVSYTAQEAIFTIPESKVILSQEEAKEHPIETIMLIAENYSVYASRPLLAEYSEYFKSRFQSRMEESTADCINLSTIITANGLRNVLSILNKLHQNESTYSPPLPLNDAFELIINADMLCIQTLIDVAYVKLSTSLREDESQHLLKRLLENTSKPMHPLVKNLLLNSREWIKRYQADFSSYILDADVAMVMMPRMLMHMSLDEYESKMLGYSVQLEALTQVKWFFNGLYLCSERTSAHHPDDPKHRDIYARVITSLLINRGILSGKICDSLELNRNMVGRWSCNVVNQTSLFLLDGKKLSQDIEEASQLINEISGYDCHYLQLYPLPFNHNIEPLAKIGCLVVRKYYDRDVEVIDYNIKLLRFLKSESITLEVLNSKYPLLDKSKPLFDQIISQKRQEILLNQMASKAGLLTKWNTDTNDAATVHVQQKSEAKTDCGF